MNSAVSYAMGLLNNARDCVSPPADSDSLSRPMNLSSVHYRFHAPGLMAPGLMRLFLLVLIVFSGVLAGCGPGTAPAHDPYGAYNTLGGAHRDNDFSGLDAIPVENLTVMEFPSLSGGLLAPPLELSGGRMALLARSDTATTLAIILRDSVLCRYRFSQGEYPFPMLAADTGLVYAITTRGELHAVDMEGAVRWKKGTFQGLAADRIVVPAAPLAFGDGVVVGNSAGGLMRFDRTGRQIWNVQRGASLGSFLAGDPGLGLVAGLTHNSYELTDSVSLIDPATGSARWTKPLPEGRLIYGPIIVGNLIVVGAASRDTNELRVPYLAAFRSDGSVAWRYALSLLPRGISADAEGNIYASCAGTRENAIGGALLSMDSAGRRRWEINFESGTPAPPLVTASYVYVITRNQGRTGLFTYSRDGAYANFVSIHMHPDVLATMMLSSSGEVFMAGVDQAVLLRGA